MLELLVGFVIFGSLMDSLITPDKKPEPKSSNSNKPMLILVVLNPSLNEEELQDAKTAIEATKSE